MSETPSPTVRVKMLVTTQYMPYGPLIAGQEYDVDPIDARHWIYEEFAEAIPGVTPIAAAILTSAGHVDLSLPGVLPASQVAEFEQSNPLLQGLGVYMQNGHLTTRTKGFYTITFYVLTDRRINGLASVRINGQDYRSMPLEDTAGNKGQSTGAATTCVAVGPLEADVEISAVFQSMDTTSASLVEATLTVMGG